MVSTDVLEAATQLADAIRRRDVAALRTMLAPGFVHRAHGGAASQTEAFLAGIAAIPGDIMFVTLEQIDVDVTPAGVLVTGIQHARVAIDGTTVDDRRRFVDWFVRGADAWRLLVAVDLPDQVA